MASVDATSECAESAVPVTIATFPASRPEPVWTSWRPVDMVLC